MSFPNVFFARLRGVFSRERVDAEGDERRSQACRRCGDEERSADEVIQRCLLQPAL